MCIRDREFIIFNLSSDLPGTHWVYLTLDSIDEAGQYHYQLMDSLGANSTFIKKNFESIDKVYVPGDNLISLPFFNISLAPTNNNKF